MCFSSYLSKLNHNTYIYKYIRRLSQNYFVSIKFLLSPGILGWGRLRSVHLMCPSFACETEGAFDVAFELRQRSSCRGDAIGLAMQPLRMHHELGDGLRRAAIGL